MALVFIAYVEPKLETKRTIMHAHAPLFLIRFEFFRLRFTFVNVVVAVGVTVGVAVAVAVATAIATDLVGDIIIRKERLLHLINL